MCKIKQHFLVLLLKMGKETDSDFLKMYLYDLLHSSTVSNYKCLLGFK